MAILSLLLAPPRAASEATQCPLALIPRVGISCVCCSGGSLRLPSLKWTDRPVMVDLPLRAPLARTKTRGAKQVLKPLYDAFTTGERAHLPDQREAARCSRDHFFVPTPTGHLDAVAAPFWWTLMHFASFTAVKVNPGSNKVLPAPTMGHQVNAAVSFGKWHQVSEKWHI